MNFLRLLDPLLTVLFEDADIIAVDKPYGFNTHTNDSKVEHSEFIEEGLIEMLEKQRGHRLHIIHRLDQTTTGVIIFGKSTEAAKKYAQYFFDRQVKKTYLFVTAAKSSQPSFLIDQIIVHKAKELEAKTQLTFLKSSKLHELWQANPFTGRNHQIRIHAQAAGVSILGDPKYGGRDYQFLCLHNHRIEFPNGIVVHSKPPAYFENLEVLEDPILARCFFEADRRFRLFSFSVASEQCFRLVHGKSGLKDNDFSIDHCGPRLVLNWQKDSLNEAERKRFAKFAEYLTKPLLVRLPKWQEFLSTHELEENWLAKEGEIQIEFRSETHASLGLSANQRLQRNWVLNNSKDLDVLNLFAGACGFSVAAALGKARSVVAVESSKSLLSWGRRNFEVNGQDLSADTSNVKLFCRDALTFLKQSFTKNQRFDLITCEVPSFLRMEKGVFKIENDLETLLSYCLQSLKTRGKLLVSTTSESLHIQDFRRIILQAQKTAKLGSVSIDCIQSAFDFELPYEKAQLKSFLITCL